jgi:hypothetical protein
MTIGAPDVPAVADSTTLSTLRVPQERETTTTEVQRERFVYRYAYARSADSKRADLAGQDYLAVREDGRRLAFVLCDGVSQSFFGDVAARVLGDALVDWLWERLAGGAGALDAAALQTGLLARLRDLGAVVSAQVAALVLPETLPRVVRDVLEQKRRLGSETTCAAGALDTTTDGGGRLALAWLGDSRLRLWGPTGETTAVLGGAFLTRERWSSRRGPIGDLHVAVRPLAEVKSLASYSDGLATLDQHASLALDNAALDALIAAASASPASDDVSFIQIAPRP